MLRHKSVLVSKNLMFHDHHYEKMLQTVYLKSYYLMYLHCIYSAFNHTTLRVLMLALCILPPLSVTYVIYVLELEQSLQKLHRFKGLTTFKE